MILTLFMHGPNTSYPAHAHPAEENYLILSGVPTFQIESDQRSKRCEQVKWHGSHQMCPCEPHKPNPSLRYVGGVIH